jgi:hypothetical protein
LVVVLFVQDVVVEVMIKKQRITGANNRSRFIV